MESSVYRMEIIRKNTLKSKENWFIFIVCIIGFALRLYRLTTNDFWYDECFTFSRVFYKETLYNLRVVDGHPSLYYFILKIWCLVFGFNDSSLRFFSVSWGTLSVVLTYKLTRVLFSRQSALLSATIIALSPFHIWYAQEARMFTMSLSLNLLSLYFFLRLLKKQSYKYWVGYFLSTVAFVFTSYHALFLFIPQVIIILVFYWRVYIRWILVVSMILFLFVLFSDVIKQATFFHYNFWLSNHNYLGNILYTTFDNFILGYNGSPSSYNLAFVVSLITSFYYFKKISKDRLIIFLLFILPVLSVLFISKLYGPVYIHRNLIIISPFLYIILSEGITSIKQSFFRRVIIFLLGVTIIFSLVNYYNNRVSFKHMYPGVNVKKPIKPIVKLFFENQTSGDGIGISNFGFQKAFLYYLLWDKKEYYFIPTLYLYLSGTDSYYEKNLMLLSMTKGSYGNSNGISIPVNLGFNDIRKFRIKRLWLFSTSWSRQGELDWNDKCVKEWFDARFPKEKQWYMDGVWVTIYNLTSPYRR